MRKGSKKNLAKKRLPKKKTTPNKAGVTVGEQGLTGNKARSTSQTY